MVNTRTSTQIPLREYIDRQARGLGVNITGKLRRCEEYEPSHLHKAFVDEKGSIYVLRHGILTIIGPDGKVY